MRGCYKLPAGINRWLLRRSRGLLGDDLPVEVGELGLLRLGPRLPALQQVVHEYLRPRLAPRTRGQRAKSGERALPEQQTRKVWARQSEARHLQRAKPDQPLDRRPHPQEEIRLLIRKRPRRCDARRREDEAKACTLERCGDVRRVVALPLVRASIRRRGSEQGDAKARARFLETW